MNITPAQIGLNYSLDCTSSTAWYDQTPRYHISQDVVNCFGNATEAVNINFIRGALVGSAANYTDLQVSRMYVRLTEVLTNATDAEEMWCNQVVDDVETACILGDLINVDYADLPLGTNCTKFAAYITFLDERPPDIQLWFDYSLTFSTNLEQVPLVVDLIRSAVPEQYQNSTDLQLWAVYNHWIWTSYMGLVNNITAVTKPDPSIAATAKCRTAICDVAEYTGNPDIAGIGVSIPCQAIKYRIQPVNDSPGTSGLLH
jgi:hypothetical protein